MDTNVQTLEVRLKKMSVMHALLLRRPQIFAQILSHRLVLRRVLSVLLARIRRGKMYADQIVGTLSRPRILVQPYVKHVKSGTSAATVKLALSAVERHNMPIP